MARRPRQSSRGFTLLELVLVMIIACTMLALVAPSLRGVSKGAKMRDAADQVLALARWAKTQAISTATIHRLQFDSTKGTYWVTMQEGTDFINIPSEFGRTFSLPDGYSLRLEKEVSDVQDYVEFSPTGRTEVATIRITADDGEVINVRCPSAAEDFKVETGGDRP